MIRSGGLKSEHGVLRSNQSPAFSDAAAMIVGGPVHSFCSSRHIKCFGCGGDGAGKSGDAGLARLG